jgi:hypothetical protein
MMRNRSRRLTASCVSMVLSGLMCLMSGPLFAAEPTLWPGMTVSIGGQAANSTTGISWNFDEEADTYTLAAPVTYEVVGVGSLTIGNAQAIPDPLLLFSASVTNMTANPLAYSFAFNTPLVPNLLGLVDSYAELGLTLTDGLNNGATVQPTLPGGTMLTSFDLYGNGTPISKNVDVGDLFSIVSGTSGTTFTKTSTLTCSEACVTMSAILSFTLTGQDAVGFTGKVIQTSAVPIPAAVWLFGSGVVALAGLARRNGLFHT